MRAACLYPSDEASSIVSIVIPQRNTYKTPKSAIALT